MDKMMKTIMIILLIVFILIPLSVGVYCFYSINPYAKMLNIDNNNNISPQNQPTLDKSQNYYTMLETTNQRIIDIFTLTVGFIAAFGGFFSIILVFKWWQDKKDIEKEISKLEKNYKNLKNDADNKILGLKNSQEVLIRETVEKFDRKLEFFMETTKEDFKQRDKWDDKLKELQKSNDDFRIKRIKSELNFDIFRIWDELLNQNPTIEAFIRLIEMATRDNDRSSISGYANRLQMHIEKDKKGNKEKTQEYMGVGYVDILKKAISKFTANESGYEHLMKCIDHFKKYEIKFPLPIDQ